MPADQPAATESLFEVLMAEAVAPLTITLPDGADTASWVIEAVDADGVADLDDLHRPAEILDALLGEEIADEVAKHLDALPWAATLTLTDRIRAHFALPDLPRGMWGDIVEQIECYGPDIESDLAQYRGGWDLLDWFRGRRPWPQLVRTLPRLPDGSRYIAALLDDDDLARERLEREDEQDTAPAARTTPPLVGETPERTLLRGIASALLRVEFATYAAAAGPRRRGSPPRPLPGPQTAQDRLRAGLAIAEAEDIFDQATPWWRDQDDPTPTGFHEIESGLYVPD